MDRSETTLHRISQFDIRCHNPYCFASENDKGFRFKQCTGCKGAEFKGTEMKILYCSRECQKSDWPMHKLKCREKAKVVEATPMKQIGKYQSKNLKALNHWKLGVYTRLIWATCEAFKMDATIDPTQNYLRIDLQEVDGPDGRYITPVKMVFISKEDYNLWSTVNQGSFLFTTAIPWQSLPNSPVDRTALLVYKDVSILATFGKEEQLKQGMTGPFPSIRQWPFFLQMEAASIPDPCSFAIKYVSWEARLHGWAKFGFDEVYPILGDFSLVKGWVASNRDYALFKAAIDIIDEDDRVQDYWDERLGKHLARSEALSVDQNRSPENLLKLFSTSSLQ